MKHLEKQRPGPRPVCPDDTSSFGYTLWLILGSENARIREAAQQLRIRPTTLSAIIHGRKKVSQSTLAKKNWRETLSKSYAKTWRVYQADFEQRAVTLPEQKRAYKSCEPKDKTSFGHILWLILGGIDTNIRLAAKHLDTPPSSLNAIIQGRQKVKQKMLITKNWRNVLAGIYVETWQYYQADFEKRVAQLRSGEDGKTSPCQPKDKEGFGYVLWLILGGNEADIYQAAYRLGISQENLIHILHGRKKILQQELINKNWCEVLAAYYPNAWQHHQIDFERRAFSQFENFRYEQKVDGTFADWRRVAQEFIKRVLDENGDGIEDILPVAKKKVFKRSKTWQRLQSAGKNSHVNLFKSALTELCKIYHLQERPGESYARAQLLISRLETMK